MYDQIHKNPESVIVLSREDVANLEDVLSYAVSDMRRELSVLGLERETAERIRELLTFAEQLWDAV